jgi:hypothetical protein
MCQGFGGLGRMCHIRIHVSSMPGKLGDMEPHGSRNAFG